MEKKINQKALLEARLSAAGRCILDLCEDSVQTKQ